MKNKSMKGKTMEKTDKRILQTMGIMSVAILIGVFIQHRGSENISVESYTTSETFSEADIYVENNPKETSQTIDMLDPLETEIELAPKSIVIDSGSFGEAFAQARNLLGPNHTFIWNGQSYTTHLADEVPKTPTPVQKPNSDELTSPGTSLAEVAPTDVTTFPDGPDFVKAE